MLGWAEALQIAMYIINLSPSKPIEMQVPKAQWTGQMPKYDWLFIFGCEVYEWCLRTNDNGQFSTDYGIWNNKDLFVVVTYSSMKM